MESLIFNSFLNDVLEHKINIDNDVFKCMLVTSDYVPNKIKHKKRNHITNEVIGDGYVAGGKVVQVVKDVENDIISIILDEVSWINSTIKAAGASYYKVEGKANKDRLVAYVGFGNDVISINSTFNLETSIISIYHDN
jgi:hypothetical protein